MPVRQLATRLTPRGWTILGGGAVAAILFIYLFVHMVSKPSYSTLATGLEPAQTGKMTSALDQHGISYELQNNGTALAVQSNETAQARVALAGAGLLGNSQPGFSLFEKSSLGESNFQQQVTYQRALQGQLEQTIDNIQGVSGAQVELVLPNPQNQLFGEGQNTSSAAVLLSGTSSLSPTSVRGIAQLVASSVPGLHLQKVTITDGTGQLLWPAQNGESAAGATGKQAAQERYDEEMQAGLDAMLAQTIGAGKAEVQVYADLNTNQTTQESLTYGKAGVPLQQSKNLETLTGCGGGRGATGTANIPAYAQTGASGKSNYKHEMTASTLGVNKVVTHSTIAPGADRKRARLGAARQHRARRLGHRDQGSGHQRRRPPAQARRHDLDRPDGLRQAHGSTAAGASGGVLGYAKYAADRASPRRLPVLHDPRAAPPRTGGDRRSSRPGCASSSCPCASPSSNAKTPPRPAESPDAALSGAGAGGAPARPCAARSSSSPKQPRPRGPAAAQLDAGGVGAQPNLDRRRAPAWWPLRDLPPRSTARREPTRSCSSPPSRTGPPRRCPSALPITSADAARRPC